MASKWLHALNYLLLGAVVLFLVWLWHDTKIHDAAALQAVAQAKASQASEDREAQAATQAANANLQKQNTALQKQLSAAKTAAQQAQLVNTQDGTHILVPTETPTLQSENPSQATLPLTDLPILAKDSTDCSEAQNQVEADKVQFAADKTQISSRDKTIADQGVEITTLQGGSHWKRFVKAMEYVGIGIVIGATEEAIRRQ